MALLLCDTKSYSLSTRGGSSQILNGDYKSNILFHIPDMIIKDDTVEYIQFSIPYCVVPISFYTINDTNNTLHLITQVRIRTQSAYETYNNALMRGT